MNSQYTVRGRAPATDCRVYRFRTPKPIGLARKRPVCGPPSRLALMEMPKVRVQVKDDLVKRVKAAAEQLWPGHNEVGVNRLARDAVRRYARYCNEPGNRSKS